MKEQDGMLFDKISVQINFFTIFIIFNGTGAAVHGLLFYYTLVVVNTNNEVRPYFLAVLHPWRNLFAHQLTRKVTPGINEIVICIP